MTKLDIDSNERCQALLQRIRDAQDRGDAGAAASAHAELKQEVEETNAKRREAVKP